MKTKTNKEILKELVDSLDETTIKDVLSKFIKKDNKEDYKKRASDFLFETFKETKFSIFDEKDIILYNTEDDWLIQLDFKDKMCYIHTEIFMVIKEIFNYEFENYINSFLRDWIKNNLGWYNLEIDYIESPHINNK